MLRRPLLSRLKRHGIPQGIRTIVWVRTIRWVGWGFGEALLPVFMFQFAYSFTEAGIFRSAYEVAFLLSLPLVTLWADRVASRTLILVGLIIYPFVGLSFFVAGMTGVGLFIIAARLLNGVAACLDAVGIDTYVRRHAIGSSLDDFGYLSTWTEMGWLGAVIIGFFLIPFTTVYALLFLIAPFSILALLLLLRLKEPAPAPALSARAASNAPSYLRLIKDIGAWDWRLRFAALCVFGIETLAVIVALFLPLAVFENGGSLQEVVLMTIIFSIPAACSLFISDAIAKVGKRTAVTLAVLAIPVLLFLAGLLPAFWTQTLAAFGIELSLVSIALVLQVYITDVSPADHYGRVSAAMEGVNVVGSLVAPVLLGLVADLVGLRGTFVFTAIMTAAIVALFYFLFRKKYFRHGLLAQNQN